jgi:glycosyltransferase involved in cell wall biosynthesis
MFQNEAEWLKLLLSVLVKPSTIDMLIGLDGGSEDNSVAIFKAFGGMVYQHPFDTPGKQQNRMIEYAENLGYDVLLKVDPDELMFVEHINQIRQLFETTAVKAVAMPRYNFIGDRYHYAPCNPYYPDLQLRAYRLNKGAYYPKDYHSGLNLSELGWKWPNDCTTPLERRDVLTLSHMHIYHYGDTKPRAQRILQYMNYERKGQGLPPLDALPEGHVVSEPPFNVPFVGAQPIAPEIAEAALSERVYT